MIHPTEVELQTDNKEKVMFLGTLGEAEGTTGPARLRPDVPYGFSDKTKDNTGKVKSTLAEKIEFHMADNTQIIGSAVRKAIENNADQIIVLSGVHGDTNGCLSDEDDSYFFDSDNILPVISALLTTPAGRNIAMSRRKRADSDAGPDPAWMTSKVGRSDFMYDARRAALGPAVGTQAPVRTQAIIRLEIAPFGKAPTVRKMRASRTKKTYYP